MRKLVQVTDVDSQTANVTDLTLLQNHQGTKKYNEQYTEHENVTIACYYSLQMMSY